MNKEIPEVELTIHNGADYQVDLIYAEDDETPVDLTGWEAEAQLRSFPQDYIAYDFICSADQSGIHLSMDHEQTAAIPFAAGYWDCFITSPDGIRDKLCRGEVTVIKDVTR